MIFSQTLINVITSKNISIYTVHNFFPGKGHESIDLPNSSKIFKSLPAKTEIYPKVLGGNFNFIFNFSFTFNLMLEKNSHKS